VKTLWDGEYLLLLVADGAGGHEAGDAAATASVETFDELLPSEGPVPVEGDPRIWLHDTILRAHERVVDLATSRIRPPASTLVGVLVELASLCAWRFHVGDSRLYVRGLEGMVSQWTRDHNITNGLIDRGLSVEQAMRIADGGRLTQVVGGTSDIEPEIHGPLELKPGQVLLLCSDGVYGHNEDPEILPAAMDPGLAAAERGHGLRDGVLAGEAPDNLTAVLWHIDLDVRATVERETVTNSMPSVSADAIKDYLAKRNLADLERTEGSEKATDPRLSPEDALTVGAMDVHVPTQPATGADDQEEDTLNTLAMDSLRRDRSADSEGPSTSAVAAVAAAAEMAVYDSTRDTRSALLLVLGLVVMLVATYTTVVKDMRGDTVAESSGLLSGGVPAAELPDDSEVLPEAELPDNSEVLPEAELPGSPELLPEDELPGEPAVEPSEDLELPDLEAVQPAGLAAEPAGH
jgi:serine/threonine protein phosphatase PrpC